MVEERKLTFPVLSDPQNRVAMCFGVVFELPEDLREQHLNFGLDLEVFNGEASWTLPQPSRFLADRRGTIRYAAVDFDVATRLDPEKIIEAVKRIH